MKFRLSFIFILLFIYPCFSQNNKIQISVQPYTGVLFGSHNEIWYSSLDYGKEVSRLEWKMSPLWTIGTNVSTKIDDFIFDISTEYAIPIKCGKMFDSDFDTFSGIKYCYSINELKSKLNLHLNLDLSYMINLTEDFKVMPKTAVYYYYDSFEARNGFGWYGMETKNNPLVSWDDNRAKYYGPGELNGVDFYRHSVLSFVGFNYSFTLQKFSINIETLLSPFSYFYTMDTHLSKNRNYKYKQIQYSLINQYLIGLTIYYQITSNNKFSLNISHTAGNISKGKFYTENKTNSFILINQQSGSDFTLTSIKTGMEFSF